MPRKNGPSWPAGTRSQSLGMVGRFDPSGAVDDVGPQGREVDRVPVLVELGDYFLAFEEDDEVAFRVDADRLRFGTRGQSDLFLEELGVLGMGRGREQGAGDKGQQRSDENAAGPGPLCSTHRWTSWRWWNAVRAVAFHAFPVAANEPTLAGFGFRRWRLAGLGAGREGLIGAGFGTDRIVATARKW